LKWWLNNFLYSVGQKFGIFPQNDDTFQNSYYLIPVSKFKLVMGLIDTYWI